MRSTIAKASCTQSSPAIASYPSTLPGYGHLEANTCGFAAENALKEEAKKPKYSLSLLKIVSGGTQPLNIRLAAALAFKNFIRHNYVVRSAITPATVVTIHSQHLTPF